MPETIVLAPPPIVGSPRQLDCPPLKQGFALARAALAHGPVRLVANGATIRAVWPDWAGQAEGLTLTELGAYRIDDPVSATRTLAAAVRQWLDDLFGNELAGIAPSQALFSSACSRFLQPLFEAEAYSAGLDAAHGSATIICADPDWRGSGDASTRAGFTVRIAGSLALAWARAAAGQLRNYLRAAPSRRALRQGRHKGHATPRLWLALVPDWRRINRHVIDRFGTGEPFGVLLVTTLAPGNRDGGQGEALWPGLDDLPVARDSLPIEQLVGPETLAGLLGVIARAGILAARLGWCLARRGPRLDLAGRTIDLGRHCKGLSALLTTDVMQALACTKAFAALTARHEMNGSRVVFAALNQVDSASAEALLRGAGAATMDLRHGAGGESWVGQTETFAATAAVWSGTDSLTVARLGQKAEVLPPPGLAPLIAAGRARRKVLVLTNYVHRDWATSCFPMAPFQTQLLEAMQALDRARPGYHAFRWRPHPDDDEQLVREGATRAPALELAREGSLDAAFDWADVVVASPSSTVAEALGRGLPCFVHVPPGFEVLPEFQAIVPERRFFREEELVERFTRFASAFESGAAEALAPEIRARERFWPGAN